MRSTEFATSLRRLLALEGEAPAGNFLVSHFSPFIRYAQTLRPEADAERGPGSIGVPIGWRMPDRGTAATKRAPPDSGLRLCARRRPPGCARLLLGTSLRSVSLTRSRAGSMNRDLAPKSSPSSVKNTYRPGPDHSTEEGSESNFVPAEFPRKK
jgi:hypothetical protein